MNPDLAFALLIFGLVAIGFPIHLRVRRQNRELRRRYLTLVHPSTRNRKA